METRIVHTKIWDDQWFFNLSPEAQRLFLFLLSCREINICGIFELPDTKIQYYMRYDEATLKKIKKELPTKVKFWCGWVAVKNVDLYNRYAGPHNEIARENQLKVAPKIMIDYVRGIDTSINTSMDTHLNTNHNLNHNQNNNKRVEEIKSRIRKKFRVEHKNEN